MENPGYRIELDNDQLDIETGAEMVVFMNLIPKNYHREIITQSSEWVSDLIVDDRDFIGLLSATARGNRKDLIVSFPHFRNVITNGVTLRNTLSLLADETDQEILLLKFHRNELRDLIHNHEILAQCLDWLYGKMDELFIEKLGWDFVTHFISSGESLTNILKSLTGREAMLFIDNLGWGKIEDCIRTSNDLILAFNALNDEHDALLLNNLDLDKLTRVIPSTNELNRVCKHLTEVNENLLRQKLAHFYGEGV